MTADTAQPMIRLDVAPSRAPMDAEITVRVLDASPGGQVTLTARSTDAAGQAWQSAATFIADQSGTVDPAAARRARAAARRRHLAKRAAPRPAPPSAPA